MECYIVFTKSGNQFGITEDEYKEISVSKTGTFISRLKRYVSKDAISEIVPQEDAYEKGESGVLHDGTKVVRYFGSWYVEGEVNENGKPCKVIDPAYYPEVAKDCVPSPREYYEKYAHLPLPQRKTLIAGSYRPKSDLMPLNGLLKTQ